MRGRGRWAARSVLSGGGPWAGSGRLALCLRLSVCRRAAAAVSPVAALSRPAVADWVARYEAVPAAACARRLLQPTQDRSLSRQRRVPAAAAAAHRPPPPPPARPAPPPKLDRHDQPLVSRVAGQAAHPLQSAPGAPTCQPHPFPF